MSASFPNDQELCELIGKTGYDTLQKLREFIATHYVMETLWAKGWKEYAFQTRYRRGGKTLCTLLYRQGEAVCVIVFGAKEREKAEAAPLSPEARANYNGATTYHDGKWVSFPLRNDENLRDVETLLLLKRRPVKAAVEA